MAEDLIKIQFTLGNEIKAELQAVQKAIAAIPFEVMKNEIAEASNIMEERINSLEHRYNCNIAMYFKIQTCPLS